MRGATVGLHCSCCRGVRISIHAPHARSDQQAGREPRSVDCISIHAPHARSDFFEQVALAHIKISIHAPHARSDLILFLACRARLISIHAPHARSDATKAEQTSASSISIHAPHARSDSSSPVYWRLADRFQSTLLMRGATLTPLPPCRQQQISIHAPHARSDMGPLSSQPVSSQISIHAPHARSDSAISRKKALSLLFQSTLLMRGATISRHRSRSCRRHFNPRSSCEERLAALDCVQCIAVFQSTLLMRGATLCSAQRPLGYCDFNPRSSCEERP